jgi:hypothetical protein
MISRTRVRQQAKELNRPVSETGLIEAEKAKTR